jgi:MerR family transcriptional regulator, redox-sensitive transcriptional activator SoxR
VDVFMTVSEYKLKCTLSQGEILAPNLKARFNFRFISCYPGPMSGLLTISDVSRRSGVASSALRFYEDKGLIASERAGSGHRRYPRAVLRRIAFIVFAQKMGLTLDEVGVELSRLPSNHVPERADWAKISGSWTKRIDERIAELQRIRAGLTQCIGCGCLSLQQCQLANPGDRAGKTGSGPRFWVTGTRTPSNDPRTD